MNQIKHPVGEGETFADISNAQEQVVWEIGVAPDRCNINTLRASGALPAWVVLILTCHSAFGNSLAISETQAAVPQPTSRARVPSPLSPRT
jgi:hypothetical protein